MTREATEEFFAPREGLSKAAVGTTTTTTVLAVKACTTINTSTPVVAEEDLCDAVTEAVNNPEFVTASNTNNAPLAMLAFAKVTLEKIILNRQIDSKSYFEGLAMTALR
mgnify:CR=1 FL=1